MANVARWIPCVEDECAKAERRLEQTRPPDLQQRLVYLRRLKREWAMSNRLVEPRIFVSFAGEAGHQLHKIALNGVRNTTVATGGPRFEVSSGMRRAGDPNVLEQIQLQMSPCFGFLGILTKEYVLSDGQTMPGPWVIYETGMALAFRLRCVLLIEEGIHPDVWRKEVGHVRHVLFTKADFRTRLGDALNLFREHYMKDIVQDSTLR